MLLLGKSIEKHDEKESTPVGTLQRDSQSILLDGFRLLRGNEQRQVEYGFGVAGMNPRSEIDMHG